MRPILQHLEHVKAVCAVMEVRPAFSFAAACAERAWPIYLRASDGAQWEHRDAVRGALDAIWEFVSCGEEFAYGKVAECEDATNINIETSSDDGAFKVAGAVFGLASSISTRQPRLAYQAAQANCDILDAFLYSRLKLPVCSANDTVIGSQVLMQTELQRQLRDLSEVTSIVVSELRKRAVGEGLLDGLWYDNTD